MAGSEKIMVRHISQWENPGRNSDDTQKNGRENENNLCGFLVSAR